MAITGNFRGTTQPSFQLGKVGATIYGKSTTPHSPSTGDLWIDPTSQQVKMWNGSTWDNVLKETNGNVNIDNGTMFIETTNDTVSIGSTASNEKLFVNGNLRLGTNPSLQFSGTSLDLRHSNGSTSTVRIRDNTSNTDPVFSVYNADNVSEVFRVSGANITLHNSYTMPVSDGSADQYLKTDGNGTLSWATVSGGSSTLGELTDVTVTTPASNNILIYNSSTGNWENIDPGFWYDSGNSQVIFTANVVVEGSFTSNAMITDYGAVTESLEFSTDYGSINNVGATRFVEKTANYTLADGESIIVDSTVGALTMTLPASPTLGAEVRIMDGGFNAATNNITIARNGSNIDGAAIDLTIDTNGAAFGLVYYNATRGWMFTER